MNKRSISSWGIKSSDPDIAIREYRGMVNDLTRLISDWVWETDARLRLSYVSEKLFSSLGISAEAAIGRKITQLGTFKSATGEPTEPNLTRPFRNLVFEAENRDGEIRHMLISGAPIYDVSSGAFSGVRGVTHDITEEKANKDTSDKLGFAVENYPGIFVLTDPADRLVFVNRTFRELNRIADDDIALGIPFENHIRTVVEKGSVPDAIGKEEEWISYRMYLHRNPHGSFEIQRQNGFVMQLTEFKLEDGSTATFSTDITELKRVETALRKSAERNRIFSMNVGHDLRTPLAVLGANIDNMKDKKTAASLRQDLVAMTRSVEQLLDSSKWESSEIGDNDIVDLSKIAQEVVSKLAASAIQAGKKLGLKGAAKPVLISGLAEPIEIAIKNLLENAIEYGVAKSNVVIQVTKSGEVLIIDKGPGIQDRIKENLKNPQIRYDRRGPGNGLGLSIVQRIAEVHGAPLDIIDNDGGGTTCRLQFRLAE